MKYDFHCYTIICLFKIKIFKINVDEMAEVRGVSSIMLQVDRKR